MEFHLRPKICLDDQRTEFEWFDLSAVVNDKALQNYTRTLSNWLLNKAGSRYD